jgi:hypothetical protein
MLVLLCVQVVQTNKNKSSWGGKKQAKDLDLAKKKMEINFKNLINKIHKLIVKEFKTQCKSSD